jgi:hypothetical protein
MSRNSIKAVDLFADVLNWDGSIKNAFDDEVAGWTSKRNEALAKFRKAMSKITKEEFLAGRWGNTPMKMRTRQWDEMAALASTGHQLSPTRHREHLMDMIKNAPYPMCRALTHRKRFAG